jgi:hypothetical protein
VKRRYDFCPFLEAGCGATWSEGATDRLVRRLGAAPAADRAESSASISSLYKIAVALASRIQDLFGQY